MTKPDQIAFFEAFIHQQREILLSKGDDYAGTDRLSNFKLAGKICGLDAELNCLSLIATKVARLGQLLHGRTPKNESIQDTLTDLANYAVLLAMIKHDSDGLGDNNRKDETRVGSESADGSLWPIMYERMDRS
jgi:hypothetical protein